MNTKLKPYIDNRIQEANLIEAERKNQLESLASFIQEELSKGAVNLNFICTHNSRRSHLSQIWAHVAAHVYKLDINTYSGGTESTAIYPSILGALKEAGFEVTTLSDGTNPVQAIRFDTASFPIIAFSKKYDHSFNPSSNFSTIMTCGHADENCPVIAGATARIPLTYVDPKVSDGTDEEAETYQSRCQQIARELLYAFSLVR